MTTMTTIHENVSTSKSVASTLMANYSDSKMWQSEQGEGEEGEGRTEKEKDQQEEEEEEEEEEVF